MAFIFNAPFTTPSNYTIVESSKAEITGGKAQLKLINNINQTFNQDFATDTGFTYDSSKAEFTGGLVRELDQAPTNSTCWATYTSLIDLNVSLNGGSLTGTATGGAVISGNKLDLTGGTSKYIDYNALNNADSQQVGCIKFKMTVPYSGAPAGSRAIFTISKANADNKNIIYLYHSVIGNLYLSIFDSAGVAILSTVNLGGWSPVATTDYEFELNWDITSGATRLFIDGVQKGATQVGTGTRDANIGLLRIGGSLTGSVTTDYEIFDLIIFDTVQHTSNYTPGYVLTETRYLESKVELPQFNYPGIGAIQEFTNLVTTETNAPRQVWNDLYWNGSVWSASDGSFDQANIVADIVANIATFPISDTLDIDIIFSDNNTTQMSIDNLIVTYTGQIYPIDNPTVEINETFYMEGLEGFTETSTKTGSDEIKYVLKKGTSWYYWDGGAWSVSDETYTQSNTATEIEANKATFTTIKIIFGIKLFLHSSDGSTTPKNDNIRVDYNHAGDTPDTVNTCIVWGYTKNANNTGNNSIVKAYLNTSNAKYKDNINVVNDEITDTADDTGFWELELIETENMETGAAYYFEIDENKWLKQIPNEITKNFNDLVDA